MPVKFGTSGLRGLVTEMPAEIIALYTNAFLKACHIEHTLCVARDLRPSSKRIAGDIIREALTLGLRVLDCGTLPTPALALFAHSKNAGAIMVTGSHIPSDRNGLKFYTPQGEITKDDETEITAQLHRKTPKNTKKSMPKNCYEEAQQLFKDRYIKTFGPKALFGKRIGIYAHSAVGRDLLGDILSGLGAEVTEFGRSETFIAVDTEAVDATTRRQIQTWVQAHALDAIVSTDGDSDRPLLADETGTLVPGDILGQITAKALGSHTVVTPISSNSAVLQKGFSKVLRTKIGSPYVIAAMQEHSDGTVGYEANGGFILGFHAKAPTGLIAPLLTRDCVLPLVT
ncbi:MAG: phosphomannomutase, partial [Pseudohongiellaceae bacterium]